jgi:hypothetical protein
MRLAAGPPPLTNCSACVFLLKGWWNDAPAGPCAQGAAGGGRRCHFKGKQALAPIGTIKLRSPAAPGQRQGAETGRGPGAGGAGPGAAVCTPGGGHRGTSIPGWQRWRRTRRPGQSRPAGWPRAGLGNIAKSQAKPCNLATAPGSDAARLQPRRRTAAGALHSPRRQPSAGDSTAGHAALSAARPDQKIVPPPAAPIISAEKNPTRTIAYLTRGIKVGLMANRDDHVTNIPVVLSRRPARSGG